MNRLILSLAFASAATSVAAEDAGRSGARVFHHRYAGWQVTVTRSADAPHAARTTAPAATRAAPLPIETGSIGTRPMAERPSLTGQSHALDGIASYYWQEQMTASGEKLDPGQMTAAHPTLPFGTMVRVTHVATGRAVTVRINDRGPFTPGRVIDLSQAAAVELGIARQGLARVKLDVLASR